MPKVPFPNGFEGAEDLPRTYRNLTNCFNNGRDQIIAFPGLESIATTTTVARGLFVWNGALYRVSSTNLDRFSNPSTGAFNTIGTIVGSTPIETAVGFNTAVIQARSGDVYTLSKTDTLTNITTNSNFVTNIDVTHINGRFVYIPADGDPAYFSDVGAAGTVQALSFFDAEELPDLNNAVFTLKNTLIIGGTDSFQPFKNTANITFASIQGARSRVGYISGLLEQSNSFVFIGREKDQDPGIFIYSVTGGGSRKISNDRIDLLLSTYIEEELKQVKTARVIWRGYDLTTFTLSRDSFAIYGENFFLIDTLIGDDIRPWAGGYVAQFEGVYYTAFENKFGKLSSVNTNYGERITRKILFGLNQQDNLRFTIQSAELGLSQGFNSGTGPVGLTMSRDNIIFPGQTVFIDTGNLGEYDKKLKWDLEGGLGDYYGFAGGEFTCSEDIDFNCDSLHMDY